ncbi:MAG TPA: sulfotransferase [Roseiflexaceae bacterium]|nr:sulfotransferase [Roseiflexaceae bacterium]
MSNGPILIGGLDRSGKTLMRLSLSAHPRIAMTRRTYMWTRFYGRYGDLGRRENFERCLAAMLRHPPTQLLQPDAARIRQEFWQGAPTYARLFALVHQHHAERLGRPRWGDQLGDVERYADAIFAAYPDARMIHMIRDPRERYAAATPPAQRRLGKAGVAMARWLASLALAERNRQRYPGRYMVVRYELLVAQRAATLRAVCACIGEPFVPQMVTLEGAMRFGDDPADDADAQPLAPLSARETLFIERYAGRVMRAWGYQPGTVRLELRERLTFTLIDWPANLARAAAWRAREALKYGGEGLREGRALP